MSLLEAEQAGVDLRVRVRASVRERRAAHAEPTSESRRPMRIPDYYAALHAAGDVAVTAMRARRATAVRPISLHLHSSVKIRSTKRVQKYACAVPAAGT